MEDLSNRSAAVFLLLTLNIIVAFGLFSRYFSLVKYHVHLLFRGVGTFDALLLLREQQLEERLRNREKYVVRNLNERQPQSNDLSPVDDTKINQGDDSTDIEVAMEAANATNR